MKRLLFITSLVLITLLPMTSFAFVKVAQSGAQFLKIGVGARAIGMGEAYVAVADDANSLYWNPAGLVNIENREIAFAYTKWVADIDHGFLGYAQHLPGIGTFGLSFIGLSVGEMEETLPGLGPTGRTFGASDFMAGASYARRLTDKFSFGGTIKFIHSYLADETASGWAADMGTLYDTGFRTIRIGMVIQNFGPNQKFIEEEFPIPITFKAGMAMDILTRNKHAITTSIEMRHPNDNAETVQMGGEYWFNNVFATRLGYKYNYDTEGFTAGFGMRFDIGTNKFSFDYAYADVSEYLAPDFMDNPHRISAGFSF